MKTIFFIFSFTFSINSLANSVSTSAGNANVNLNTNSINTQIACHVYIGQEANCPTESNGAPPFDQETINNLSWGDILNYLSPANANLVNTVYTSLTAHIPVSADLAYQQKIMAEVVFQNKTLLPELVHAAKTPTAINPITSGSVALQTGVRTVDPVEGADSGLYLVSHDGRLFQATSTTPLRPALSLAHLATNLDARALSVLEVFGNTFNYYTGDSFPPLDQATLVGLINTASGMNVNFAYTPPSYDEPNGNNGSDNGSAGGGNQNTGGGGYQGAGAGGTNGMNTMTP